jgi:hypothetical protein
MFGYTEMALGPDRSLAAHDGRMLFPPLEILNTAGPLSVLPDAVGIPPRTVSWPPVGNACADPSFTSIALLEAQVVSEEA